MRDRQPLGIGEGILIGQSGDRLTGGLININGNQLIHSYRAACLQSNARPGRRRHSCHQDHNACSRVLRVHRITGRRG
jgi:hypothetical protein